MFLSSRPKDFLNGVDWFFLTFVIDPYDHLSQQSHADELNSDNDQQSAEQEEQIYPPMSIPLNIFAAVRYSDIPTPANPKNARGRNWIGLVEKLGGT